MHTNKLWVFFFSFVVLITFWFGGKALFALYHYYSLSQKAKATLKTIDIEAMGKNQFVLHCSFEFLQREGQSDLGPIYPNRYAAEKGLEQFQKKSLTVWYHPKHYEKTVLEKKFPFKATFSAALLLILSLYFFIIGVYVGKRNDSHY